MSPAGWAIMIVSIGSVCALSAFCFYRLLMLPPRELVEHEKAPLNIDTHDTDESQ